jgi:predicted O-methyltransferase YrrM
VIVDPDIERYALAHTTGPSEAVAAVRAETEATMPSPQMAGGLGEVQLLEALAVAGGATRILEVGTFTGVTSLTLAARLPEGGKLTTLEVDEQAAAIARRHFDASPFGDRIELIVGDARETIERLDGPFDLIWIDAWKRDYPLYLEKLAPKLAERGVLAADNVLLDGRVLQAAGDSEDVAGMQEFADRVQADPHLHNVLLPLGDGVMLAWRVGS